MTLKSKDIKLLTSLFVNSRKSNRQLAKEVGISKETVGNRINYFLKNKYINSLSLKVNYINLGFKEYNLFIRLKNLKKDSINLFIKYLENHNNTTWIGKAFGKYDLKIAIILKNVTQINNIINEISQKFGKNIELIDSFLVIDKFKAKSNLFLLNLFNNNNNFNSIEIQKKSKLNENKQIILDKIDKKILFRLGQNSNTRYTTLALDLDLTSEAIKYRVKNLEKNNIILGNSIVFNGNKFNKIWCLVLLNINSEKINDFKIYLKNKDFVSSYVETMGIRNFTVTFFANNNEELYDELNLIRNKFSESIRNFEFLIFFEIYKFPKLPKCILE